MSASPRHEEEYDADPDAGEDDAAPGGNCIKIGLPGKSILRYYFQENRTVWRPFLLLRISFPRRPIFIQFVPDCLLLVLAQPPRGVTCRIPHSLLSLWQWSCFFLDVAFSSSVGLLVWMPYFRFWGEDDDDDAGFKIFVFVRVCPSIDNHE